ncbi:MAG: hypothetical protein ACK4SN_10290 [Bellilinea sp.]
MSSALEKIKKFLKLEIERGFDNRAVVGGLDKIIPAWEQEANREGIQPSVIQQILNRLTQYPALSLEQREQIVQEILQIVENASNFTPDFSLNSSDVEKIEYPRWLIIRKK